MDQILQQDTSKMKKKQEKFTRWMRWFYTGDIGCFHSDGCLEIVDREKDIASATPTR